MKVAVTGGSGQLGTVVLRRLAADRAVKAIVSLDQRPPLSASKKVRAVTADVRDASIAEHLAGCDALVHLAFIVTSYATPETMQAVNVEGSKNVFRAAAAAGVGAIVYASSVAAYGIVPGHPVPIVEETPRVRDPALTYAENKFDVEAFLDGFEAEHPEIAVSRLRPATLAGRRMEHALGEAFARGVFPDLGGPPIPFVWDEDVAAAVALCLKKRARGAFNLVADAPAPNGELARAAGLRHVRIPRAALHALVEAGPLIARLSGKQAPNPAWIANELPALVYSSEKAKRELGWAPKQATTADVIRKVAEAARVRVDPKIALFLRAAALGAERMPPRVEDTKSRVRLHLELTGRGGGDWSILLAEGRLRIEGGAPRPPDGVVTLSAATFLDLLAGRQTVATAQLTGKIQIEGEPIGTMFLGGMTQMLHRGAEQPGPAGWAARQLARWLAST